MRDINPVLVRELRGRLRTPRSYWLLCGALLLVSSISLLIYSAEYASMNGQPTFNGSSGHTVFLAMVVTALVVVTAIAPIMAAGSISGERERQTFDLIVLTQLRPIDIVLGKTAATFAYCLLFVTALTPLMAITFLIGGVDIGELTMMYLIIMSTALLYTCIGVYWSSRSQTAITATGYALATILGMLLVLPVLVLVLPELLPGWIDDRTNTWRQLMLTIHPYATIIFTQDAVRMSSVWTSQYTVFGFTIAGPAMWLLSVAVSWFWSCVCTILSIRQLTPSTIKGAS
jgi:ABC-2 type transport system permease protein